MIEEWTSKK